MREFELFRPEKLAEAWEVGGPGVAFKAAGTDLVDRLKERAEAPPLPTTLVDLLPLRGTFMGRVQTEASGAKTIGALATLRQVAESKELGGPAYGALTTAAGIAATPHVRNRATVGGNILQRTRCWYFRSAEFSCAHDGKGDTCLASDGENRYHAIMGYNDCVRVHPSNLAPALLALNAQVCLQAGETSVRAFPLRELFPEDPASDMPEHLVEDGEILTFVQVPPLAAGTRSAYRESREKQSFDWPTTSAAARLVLDGGRITDASICLGAVAPVPMPRDEAAAMLKGREPSRELFEKVAKAAFEDAEPLRHNRYKVAVGQAILIDALTAAANGR